MTEADWLASTDPQAILGLCTGDADFNEGTPSGWRKVSDRKLGLWVEACRDVFVPGSDLSSDFFWDIKRPDQLKMALDAWSTYDTPHTSTFAMSLRAALLREIIGNPFRPVKLWNVILDGLKSGKDRGHDFNELWLTPTVLGIARTIYDERSFGDMPVLADALEEAGCEDAEILGHCRGTEACPYPECYGNGAAPSGMGFSIDCLCVNTPGRILPRGPHVRGCWVLDLILGND